ncbi:MULTISPECIES: DUF6571 family protein [Actinoalloteichus]|uniref:Uncharacterized protein n=1 Tax=Actinoalloteichus fjordicus TaxID=1612552 RepID=A0AAC9LHY0_9PSEU|nr:MULTISPECIES: DUF6571 family protein [Actinoalloteichus]APU17184.1 hypothetical protein UA74_25895 [Actinoalloteichus fjordicus]APU23267.1 hypothetical protein UA75_26480 [Actinoalloteichus sp. GBA129-24]
MPDLLQLRDLDPSHWSALAQAWNDWSDDLDQQLSDLNGEVIERIADDEVWQGFAAEAAGRYVDEIRRRGVQSVDDIRNVADVYKQAADDITGIQDRLASVLAYAHSSGLELRADGEIWIAPYDTTGLSDGQKIHEREVRHRARVDVQTQIAELLTEAEDLDSDLTGRLEHHSAVHSSAADIAAMQERIEEQAARAAELAGTRPLTHEEARELRDLLEHYAEDPVFATEFLDLLGPERTLELASDITGIGNHLGHPDPELARRLQIELGEALATATDARSEPNLGEQWWSDLAEAGREEVVLPGFTGPDGVYGYQFLGPLLNSGEYSSEFLEFIGNDLIDFEKENPEAWNTQEGVLGAPLRFNFIDDQTAGLDPMYGLMLALDENPQAAKDFFSKDGEDRVEYFAEREWIPDSLTRSVPDDHVSAGWSSFGDALEAATLEAGRDEVSREILRDSIGAFADRSDGIPHNMGDTMTNMISAEIAFVNADSIDSSTNRHAAHRDDIRAVIGDLASDPEQYAQIHEAQRVYTALRLEEMASSSFDLGTRYTDVEMAGREAAVIFNALDGARAEAGYAEMTSADNEYNKALEDRAALTDLVLGNIVGEIPVAGGLLGDGVTMVLDDVVENSRRDDFSSAEGWAQDLYRQGSTDVESLVLDAMIRHEMWAPDAPPPAELMIDGKVPAYSSLDPVQKGVFDEWRRSPAGGEMRSVIDEIKVSYHLDTSISFGDESRSGG